MYCMKLNGTKFQLRCHIWKLMKAIILKCAGLTGLNFELMVTYVNQVDLQDLIMMF